MVSGRRLKAVRALLFKNFKTRSPVMIGIEIGLFALALFIIFCLVFSFESTTEARIRADRPAVINALNIQDLTTDYGNRVVAFAPANEFVHVVETLKANLLVKDENILMFETGEELLEFRKTAEDGVNYVSGSPEPTSSGFLSFLGIELSTDEDEKALEPTKAATFDEFSSSLTFEEKLPQSLGDDAPKRILTGVIANSTLVPILPGSTTENIKQDITYTILSSPSQGQKLYPGSSFDTREDFYQQTVYEYPDYSTSNRVTTSPELTLQVILDTIILHQAGAINVPTIAGTNYVNFREYNKNFFLTIRSYDSPARETFPTEFVFPVMFLCFTLTIVLNAVNPLVAEKEARVREALRMLGLDDLLSFFSWLITGLIPHLPLIVLSYPFALFAAVLLKADIRYAMTYLLDSTYFFLPLLCLLGLGSVISLGLCLSSFFSSSKTSVAGLAILYAIMSVPGNMLGSATIIAEGPAKYPVILYYLGGIIFPAASIFHGFSTFARHYTSHLPITMASLVQVSPTGTIPLGIFATQLASIAFYAVMFLYLQQVVPNKYGFTQAWYFPCKRVVRHFTKRSASSSHEYGELSDSALLDASTNSDVPLDSISHLPQNETFTVQESPNDITSNDAAVVISHLQKIFPATPAPIVALKGLSLSLFSGQILTLLGHNGAGKTTLINCLTGMYSPTFGQATIFDKSIIHDMKEIQRIMGVCHQHDILFNELTVLEHFYFFGRIRGLSEERIQNDAFVWIRKVGLDGSRLEDANSNVFEANMRDDKTGALVSTLSGGQKRKLSVALAFFGDTKIVFLDEPSSGLDVDSQRQLWAIISASREGRVIILTTHSMEEAELGDRIAIMANGALQCIGTSLFLKKHFGMGYSLSVVRKKMDDIPALEHEKKIQDAVAVAAPYAVFSSSNGLEMLFTLPMDHVKQFPDLVDDLESKRNELHVSSFGLSLASLTDVFLRVAEGIESFVETHGSDDNIKKAVLAAAEAKSTNAAKLQSLYSRAANQSTGSEDTVKTMGIISSTGLVFMRRWKLNLRSLTSLITLCFMILFLNLYVNVDRLFPGYVPLSLRPITTYDMSPHGMPKIPSTLSHAPALILTSPTAKYDEKSFTTRWLPKNGMILPFSLPEDTFAWPPIKDLDHIDWILNVSDNFADYYVEKLHTEANKYFFSAFVFELNNVPGLHDVKPTDATKATLLVDYNRAVMSSPNIGLNSFSNVLLSTVYRETDNVTIKPHLRSFPAVQTNSSDQYYIRKNTIWLPIIGVYILAALATFATEILKDTETGNRHLQFTSGLSSVAYWSGNYLADLLLIMLFAGGIIVSMTLSGIDYFISSTLRPYLITLIVLFCIHGIFFVYLWTFLFKKISTGQTSIMMIMLAITFVGFIIYVVGDALRNKFVIGITNLFWIHPGFLFTMATFDITRFFTDKTTSEGVSNLVGQYIIAFIVNIVVSCILLFCLEYVKIGRWFPTSFYKWKNGRLGEVYHDADDESPLSTLSPHFGDDENGSVSQEREFVESGQAFSTDAPLIVRRLRKVYTTFVGFLCRRPPLVAVSNVSFSVSKGQCFGFLGANGAGKTTAMQMMVAEELPTYGAAYVSGIRVDKTPTAIRKIVGFCPQFDSLYEMLTVHEHLIYYSKLRGYSPSVIEWFTLEFAEFLNLTRYLSAKAGSLSGGNKRKLAVGISLLGNPSLVLLDEPSTGVDPKARRAMWDLVSATMKNRSVILTTHSMEECEALCDRIGIMVRGALRCLGSAQELKSEHGLLHNVTIRATNDKEESATEYILSSFPGAAMIESNGVSRVFTVPKITISLSSALRVLEAGKSNPEIGIETYSVSDTTLKQVFVALIDRYSTERPTFPHSNSSHAHSQN